MQHRPRAWVWHLAGLLGAALACLFLLDVSRFWIWPGPLGPTGDAVRSLLGGTWVQDFDLVIWGCGAVLVLTIAQMISDRLSR